MSKHRSEKATTSRILVHARRAYQHHRIKHGHRYADIMETLEDGRLKVGYGRFHETHQE
jgi:inward rectifier potassium channel